ncbi:MAG TPA: chemotaxis protein CheA [Polyangiales bacterium]|nr:chemotaxis protein CheA [Polyangiales bacterium]
MNIEEALPTFILESRELLEDVEARLLRGPAEMDADSLNAIFRGAHTIKGSAGLFQLDHIVAFMHGVESVLEGVRDGRVKLEDPLVTLLLACTDHARLLIEAVAAGEVSANAEMERAGAPLLARLGEYLEVTQLTAAVEKPRAAIVQPRPSGDSALTDHWHISLRFGPDVLRNGMDPLSFLRYLSQLGSIAAIETLSDALPPAPEMDPESCYLGFEIAFASMADKAAIEGVFEFVRDDCRIRILPPNSRVSEYVALIDEAPPQAPRLGEILVRCGTLTPHELEAALAAQQADAANAPKLGTILVDEGMVQPAVVDAALVKQKQLGDAKALDARSIRVDAGKLDKLIDLVGELIIATASTNMIARRTRVLDLQECAATLSGLVEEVRENALQLRMVKIGATFNRFQRVVHDVSRETGKDIRLVVSGEDTELDKTLIERLGDPLTHLVRNAIDHGIESPEERRKRSKPAQGSVRLNAYHDSGSVVIEVSDDGGGLKREKILAKAIERGLIDPERSLNEREIFDLVFEPGFSTAERITNLSGRGVGMDVVKRNIVALRGTVHIESDEGAGTTVIVRLPLTLAIINGFLVGVGKSVFVLPLDTIEECVEFPSAPTHDYTNLRGNVLPFIRLRDLFEVSDPPVARENIVVVRHAGQKTGLVVDTLFGEFQTVIKPLGKLFSGVKCISGSSLLGTGEVALILDVPALVQQAS